jgi:hypothetical protein
MAFPAASTQPLVVTPVAQHRLLSVVELSCRASVHSVHGDASISYVHSGSLSYRAYGRTFELVAGAILIGNAGVEYRCAHDRDPHGNCLSFRLAPELVEMLDGWAATRGVGGVPPLAELMVWG